MHFVYKKKNFKKKIQKKKKKIKKRVKKFKKRKQKKKKKKRENLKNFPKKKSFGLGALGRQVISIHFPKKKKVVTFF